jgi:predicted nucleic acid-binding protein
MRAFGPKCNGRKMIGYYDPIVAATAMEYGSRLATSNKRHFSAVPGLELVERL